MAGSKRALPTGRLKRTALPSAIALRTGAAVAAARVRALRGDRMADLADDPRLAAAATRAAKQMGEMKGAVMKIGQILSFVDNSFLPEQYREALAMLQADAPPMPYDLVVDVVRSELGGRPEEVYDWFSPEPIAAASIGQVHMAHLGDAEVVVKVQYPGVAEAIASDLRNAALISVLTNVMQNALRGMVGDVDTKAIVAEVRDRVTDELDYRIEARNQQRFADLYRGDPSIHVPEVVPELSTERVLTTEYVDAMRWQAALAQPQDLRDQWGLAICRFVFGTLRDARLFNADPHPGNYLFHADGRVSFLDFGCVKEFTPETMDGLYQLAWALRANEQDRILDALVHIGMLRSRDGFDSNVLFDRIGRIWEPIYGPQPFRYSRAWIESQLEELMQLRLGKQELQLMRQTDMPADHVFLTRIVIGLNSVLAQLECTVDWGPLADEIWGEQPY
ncbi:MAG TPA: AarF/ABC1/UbiB kinase family protein [Acidimicrobiales bacterium]|jgi:predicted unusual protein kinase regulating ubiquinone biosynthesis (AarF/ABC1/UbiB family)|nr:AarF/ABC1/UbiB kinase family protein [Acidimicrobiales bacterium]